MKTMAPIIKQNSIQSKYHRIANHKFILFFVIVFSSCNGFPTETENVCYTPECHQTASEVLRYMDASVNPCDNFYKFACGNYLKNTVIPNNWQGRDQYDIVADKILEQLEPIVKSNVLPNTPKHLKLANTFYNICMNETAIEEHGWDPLKAKFKKLGGWPVLEGNKWNESAFELTNVARTLRELGYNSIYLFDFDVSESVINKTETIIELKPNEVLIERYDIKLTSNRTENNELLKSYKKAMVDSAVLLGADPVYAEEEFNKTIEFEKKLLMLNSMNKKVISTRGDIYTTLGVIELFDSSIPWFNLSNIFLQPYKKVDRNSIIKITIPTHINILGKFLNDTSKRTLANYILWRVFYDSVNYLSDKYRQPIFDFRASRNITRLESRSEKCMRDLDKYLKHNIGILYAKTYSNENIKKNVTEIVSNLKSQLKTIFQTLDWMDEETKKNSIAKINAIRNLIADDDQVLDDNKMAEMYNNFELHENITFLDAMLRAKIFEDNRRIQLLPKSLDNINSFDVNAADVLARYTMNYNTIEISTGLLQGRFYNASRPQYMNYGAIGVIVSHEIMHGFDTTRKYVDDHGNIIDPWKPATNAEFEKKASCLIKQYNNYTVKDVEMNVNGRLTIDENICDNGGFKLAYSTYKNWTNLNGPDPRLPRLERFLPSQMFWITAAQTWCGLIKRDVVKDRLATDVHSPPEFRTIGTLSNIKEFSDDFGCPLESPMNPKDKCTIW